ncbi:MAG: MATE family efflux transporter, partial [Desulfovibrionaceae bacterium]|nr:MATE family efflux transporter [Desulfovibrionaceae bacterium]
MSATNSVSYRHIWTIAYPVLISLITEHLISLTDTAFLGRVGEIELGASALGGVYYWVVFMLGLGFSLGAQIMIGRRNGERNFAETGPIVVQGIIFMFALAGLAFWLSRELAPWLMSRILISQDVCNACISYIDWRAYGFFFAFAALMFRAFFVGIEQTRAIGVCSVVMVAVNVALNYLLIFGKFGFPEMGIAGAALASTIAEAVLLLSLIIYVRLRVDHEKYGFVESLRFRPRLILQVFAISIWTMLQFLISDAVWLFFLVAVEHLGERPLAVSNIVRSFSILLFMPLSAMAVASTTVTSNLLGAGQHNQVMGACRKSVKLCFAILLPLLVFS